MAFGRDGSELEMYIMDMQNRALRDALDSIMEISSNSDINKIAKSAIKRTEEIRRKLDN